jgi:transcriptional regulator with XRE-family HTH domain
MSDLESVEAVRALLVDGVSQREIVRRLGVSKGFIWRVRRGKDPHVSCVLPRVEKSRPLILDPADASKLSERVRALEAAVADLREGVNRLETKA